MINYALIPEDVKWVWVQELLTADFLEAARLQGGSFVLLGVMVRQGDIVAVVPPVWQVVEPRAGMAAVNGRSSWFNVIRRMMSVAGHRPSLVQMRVLVDTDGEPVLWERPLVSELREAKG